MRPWDPTPAPHPRPWPFLMVLAAAAMLLPPVEYRAGADVAHAHAGLQPWLDAVHGRVVHHHPADDPAATEVVPSTTGSLVIDSATGPDTPRWTSLSPVIERAALALTVVAVLAAIGATRASRIPMAALPLAGRRPRPEFPPPRVGERVSLAT